MSDQRRFGHGEKKREGEEKRSLPHPIAMGDKRGAAIFKASAQCAPK